MDYNFSEIEAKWQEYWDADQTFQVKIDTSKPKFYVLDMFPYPSGAGLHVGHPLGYIASDIFSRYKKLQGYNVLHPMGYDAFGLPAEQYAIQTGTQPAENTDKNIERYREQLKKIGLSYDWNREIKTSDPGYYKWTQWVFIKMFKHWFNNKTQKAEPIETLINIFEREGNIGLDAACSPVPKFHAAVWNGMEEIEKEDVLQKYRLAFRAKSMVNWCAELGTVLANDEVKDGLSVRGGHEVVQKAMTQWLLRVSAYSKRLLDGLENVDWSDSLKEIQKNWIGRSQGANVMFKTTDPYTNIQVFTTRPDTIYGATFMVLAPESKFIRQLVTEEQEEAISLYVAQTSKRTERERIADTKTVSGVFTGAYAINPFTQRQIPIWISDYVLAGYGSGAIMAVPAHDNRDFAFATKYELPIIQVVEGADITKESYDDKNGKMINSGIINGLEVKDAIDKIITEIETKELGERKINYRLRDAIFSRQRYWGEPFPIYYKNGIAYPLDENKLPLQLPYIETFKPTEAGEPPLARAENWKYADEFPLETSTMPGFAGSSAYYLRYMDPKNNEKLVSKEANEYWQDVDLYIGGTEHAVGHLIYSRFWNKFLYDIGETIKDEPFKKLINQGMIQGRSNFVYRIKNTNKFVSANIRKEYDYTEIHVDVNIVNNDILDIERFRDWLPEYNNAEFILEGGKYYCGHAVEKMSKSMFNVVNPDDIIEQYGTDTLRLYEMFLGPIEQSKPWDTKGIEGVHKFLRKLWRLFHNENNEVIVSEEKATPEELKILHKTIKKIKHDIENFSFNTSVSAFMICINELTTLKTNKRQILEPLTILLSSFAPHISEELWEKLGNFASVSETIFPLHNEEFLVENTVTYPIAINGKTKITIDIPADTDKKEIERIALQDEKIIKQIEGKNIIKIIVVPKRMVNIVVK